MYLKWLYFLSFISELLAVQILMSWSSSLKLIDTEDPQKLTSATNTTHMAIAVDYHYKRGEIYYSDGTGRIQRVWLRGEHMGKDPIPILETLLVDGLAVDWEHDNIYWTDTGKETVEMATIEGLHRRVLFGDKDGVASPRAIVVDPYEGLLFWSDWGKNAMVLSAGLDGNAKSTLGTDFYWPNGLTLDLTKKKLYIIDGYYARLSSCNYDGTESKVLLTSTKYLNQAFAVTYYENTLYWSSWQEKALLSVNVNSENLSPKVVHKRTDFRGLIERTMGVKVVHPSLQPSTNSNPCSSKNCSQQCLVGRHGTASCVCQFGFILGDDKKTCIEEGYLLVTWRKTIRKFNLKVDVAIPMVDGTKAAIAIDYHLRKGLVFWSDVEEHLIYSALLEQMNNKTAILSVGTCDGLAVDWVHDILYWADEEKNTIEAANLDGSGRLVLVSQDIDQPRAITLDPIEGLMFWSDWGVKPKIERSLLDGTDRKVIVNTNLFWPNGITIDNNRIYWVDGKLRGVFSTLYDGSQQEIIVLPDSVTLQPFGISFLNKAFYWTDWGVQGVLRTTLDGETKIMANSSSLFLRPNGIKTVHSSRQKDFPNHCLSLNCKGLCVGIPTSPRARCLPSNSQPNVDSSTSAPTLIDRNELSSLTIAVGNNSFSLNLGQVKEVPTFVVLTISCVNRLGCSDDKRCSANNKKNQVFVGNEFPYNVSGLLPATKYKVEIKTPSNSHICHVTTLPNDPPELPRIESVVVEGSNVTVVWDPVDTCVPNFQSYNYMVYKTIELDNVVLKESTNLTEVTLTSLHPEVNYTMRLYTYDETYYTSATFYTMQSEDNQSELCKNEELFCDGRDDCKDKMDESSEICAGITNVVVYKKTKSEASFRVDVNKWTAKNLTKFRGYFSIDGSEIQDNFEVPVVPCAVWPESYCFHISSLVEKTSYNFKISAVITSGLVGNPVSASLYTKEGVPGPPEDLKILNYSPTDVEVQWRYPNQSNGIIRNFVINIQEVEIFGAECCTPFPMTETPGKDEEPVYSIKLGGFSPASSYAISITAKTLYLGGSKDIDVFTSPPPMEILKNPELSIASLTPVTWMPQDVKPSGDTAYHTLIKSYLLLLIDNKNVGEHKTNPQAYSIESEHLKDLLESKLGSGFSVIWSGKADDGNAFKEPISVAGLTSHKEYELAWVQVSQYKDAYGLDYIMSQPFLAL